MWWANIKHKISQWVVKTSTVYRIVLILLVRTFMDQYEIYTEFVLLLDNLIMDRLVCHSTVLFRLWSIIIAIVKEATNSRCLKEIVNKTQAFRASQVESWWNCLLFTVLFLHFWRILSECRFSKYGNLITHGVVLVSQFNSMSDTISVQLLRKRIE